MAKLVGFYSITNLIQSVEYLSELSKSLYDEINILEKAREEVKQQQTETTNQGLLVKNMATYMSNELKRIDTTNFQNLKNPLSSRVSENLKKLTLTETKLQVLQRRLTKFIDGDNSATLKASDALLSIELKQYETFLLSLTTLLNEKIVTLEKIVSRIKAEKKESEQQIILLKEMITLFNDETLDLEETLKEIKKEH